MQRLQITFLVFGVALFTVSNQTNQGDNLGNADYVKTSSQLVSILQPITDKYFSGEQFRSFPPARVGVEFEFDKNQFQKDQQAFEKKLSAEKAALAKAREKRYRDMYNTVRGRPLDYDEKKTQKKAVAPSKSNGQRFGRLNIDLDPIEIDSILEESNVGGGDSAPQVTVQMPTDDQLIEKNFVYDAIVYVRNLKIKAVVPESLSENEITAFKTALSNAIGYTTIKVDPASDISIEKIAPFENPTAEKSLVEWVASPENSTIGILFAAIIIGLSGFVSIMFLAKVFSRIAGSIADLKPEPVADGVDSGGGSSTSDVSSASEEVIINAEVEDIPTRGGSSHDPAAALSAMTSEMRTIRDQLEEIIAGNAVVASELLRDLCYEKHGMEDFRDLLSFAGYNCLKDAMERLPESVVLQLQTYIEDNRDSQVNLIRGCEVAQRIYRDTVSKISVKSEATDHIKKLKDTLIKIDDGPLDQVVETASSEETAMLLKLLSVERGNRLMKKLPGDKLKEACDLLDQEIANEEQIATDLSEKLNAAQDGVEVTSHLQERFILRLAKTATVEEEDSLLQLIPQDQWAMKQAILSSKFLYSYIKYLSGPVLRGIFDSFDLAKRAEILAVTDDSIKDSLLAQYKEGTKIHEMITDELSNVQNNKKRRESVLKNKWRLIGELLDKVRALASADEDIVVETLRNEFTQLGLEIPEKFRKEEVSEDAA